MIDVDFPDGLGQPDRRSCGAACLVVAHALRHPGYAGRVSDPAEFRREVLAMHARVTSLADVRGRMQLPWPRALGTPPWAVVAQLEGTYDVPYRTRLLRRVGRPPASDLGGAPAALYVGNRWLPRHVVLVLGGDDEALRVYEPFSGRVERVQRTALAERRLRLAGWDVPWLLVAPEVTRRGGRPSRA